MSVAWGQIDASTPSATRAAYMSPSNSGAANLDALFAAYEEAKRESAALYIPAGEYAVELAQPSTPAAVIAMAEAPIIGAGSHLTILRFERPGSAASVDKAFMTDTVLAADPTAFARIEALQLVGPEVLGGIAPDGSDAPDCWALYVSDGTQIRAIDVRTTRWREAIRLDGGTLGTTAYLERCYVRSRSTRIRRSSPEQPPERDVLTLINCTIEQDDDGFVQDATGMLHCGLLQDASASLVVIGGASLGGKSRPYDFFQPAAAGGGPTQVSVSDHRFGPNSSVGLHLSSNGAAVQLDNCVFYGETGVVIDGDWSVYQVTNCVFAGGRSSPFPTAQVLADFAVTYSGFAVRDSETGHEVEAYFDNCRFGVELSGTTRASGDPVALRTFASRYDSTVVRFLGDQGKRWRFSNCLFGGLRNPGGALFKAIDGVNVFRACHFLDEREDGTYPLEQHAGRIELHACRKTGKQPIYLPSDRSGLQVVLYQNVFRQDSMLVVPTALVELSGAENEFGDHVELQDPGGWFETLGYVPVTSNLRLKRGRGPRREQPWVAGQYYFAGSIVRKGDAPERVYECADPGLTGPGPEGTANAIADRGLTWRYLRDDADYEFERPAVVNGPIQQLGDTGRSQLPVISSEPYYGLSQLIISWNADWIEFDEYGNPTIQVISMRSRRGGPYCNALVGATIRLLAIQRFALDSGGNILMGSTSMSYAEGQVATLRYSTAEQKWVLL